MADPELARKAAQQTAEAWEGGFPLSEDQYKKLIDDLKPVNNKVVSDYLHQLHERRGKDNRFLTPMDFYHVLNMVDANNNPAKKKQPSKQKHSETSPQSPDTLSAIGADVMGVIDKAQDIVGTAIDYAATKAGIAKFGADINQYHDDYLDQLKVSGKPDAAKPTAGTPPPKDPVTSSTSTQSPGSPADSPSSGQPNSAPRSFAMLKQTNADLVHAAQLGDVSEINFDRIGTDNMANRNGMTQASSKAAPVVPPSLKPPKF